MAETGKEGSNKEGMLITSARKAVKDKRFSKQEQKLWLFCEFLGYVGYVSEIKGYREIKEAVDEAREALEIINSSDLRVSYDF